MSPSSPAAKRSSEPVPTEIPMLIGGAWRAASETYDVRDPYRATVVANAPRSSVQDLDDGTSTWRTDQLAYGGVKESGIGREGPRYSIRDMTEERMVLFNL